jgi:ElaB/YqjD/DUF883 family membrane-anchored ribosome-binding protein
MTKQSSTLSDAKRDALRARIEASERRIAQRTLADDARDMAQAAVDYTKANPLKVVGGAIAIGLIIGLLSSPGRRMASNAASGVAGGFSKAARGGGAKIGMVLANALVAQGLRLLDDVLDGASAGKDRLDSLGETVGERASRLRREATDTSRKIVRSTRERTGKAARSVAQRVRR